MLLLQSILLDSYQQRYIMAVKTIKESGQMATKVKEVAKRVLENYLKM